MALILFALFIVVPVIEIAVIIQVGQAIGGGWTLVALVAVSIAGAALVKREGLRAWRRFQEALAQARIPAAEVVDGALVLLGGALMLTPGFVTDAVGLLLVFPVTRAPVNRLVRSRGRRLAGLGPLRRRAGAPRSPDRSEGAIDVEVVHVERSRPSEDHEPGGELPPS